MNKQSSATGVDLGSVLDPVRTFEAKGQEKDGREKSLSVGRSEGF